MAAKKCRRCAKYRQCTRTSDAAWICKSCVSHEREIYSKINPGSVCPHTRIRRVKV